MDTKDYLKGRATDAYTFFGNNKKDKGYIFRILAPNAREVHIIGDFNDWQPEKLRGYTTGVYSITNKNAKAGDRYQYLITDVEGIERKKYDPFARLILNDENCSVVTDDDFKFKNKKVRTDDLNIYEVHLGSLLKASVKSHKDLYDGLLDHALNNNFTHIKFMPLTEYRNYKSMGYGSSGLFAFSNRYGDVDDFKAFIDSCHGKGIGVIIDLDLSSFDPTGYYLENFDGTRLYDYDYPDVWFSYSGNLNYDPSKNMAKSYLKSAISYWINEFKADGISLSSIQNMVYWQGAADRGENKEWMDLLSEFISTIHENKALAIGEFNGNYNYDFNFDYVFDNRLRKISRIFQREPIDRDNYKKDVLSLISADNKTNIIGLSHVDSYLSEARTAMKMYGDRQKLSQLKAFFTFIYSLNSKKMLFMGDELADMKTWSVYEGVDYSNDLEDRADFNNFYKAISDLYLTNEVLSSRDSTTTILDIDGYSIYAFSRELDGRKLLVITNFTDIDYEINFGKELEELINTEDLAYGGSGNVNGKVSENEKIKIAPFGAAIFDIIE